MGMEGEGKALNCWPFAAPAGFYPMGFAVGGLWPAASCGVVEQHVADVPAKKEKKIGRQNTERAYRRLTIARIAKFAFDSL